jgi:hypothetical protein
VLTSNYDCLPRLQVASVSLSDSHADKDAPCCTGYGNANANAEGQREGAGAELGGAWGWTGLGGGRLASRRLQQLTSCPLLLPVTREASFAPPKAEQP